MARTAVAVGWAARRARSRPRFTRAPRRTVWTVVAAAAAAVRPRWVPQPAGHPPRARAGGTGGVPPRRRRCGDRAGAGRTGGTRFTRANAATPASRRRRVASSRLTLCGPPFRSPATQPRSRRRQVAQHPRRRRLHSLTRAASPPVLGDRGGRGGPPSPPRLDGGCASGAPAAGAPSSGAPLGGVQASGAPVVGSQRAVARWPPARHAWPHRCRTDTRPRTRVTAHPRPRVMCRAPPSVEGRRQRRRGQSAPSRNAARRRPSRSGHSRPPRQTAARRPPGGGRGGDGRRDSGRRRPLSAAAAITDPIPPRPCPAVSPDAAASRFVACRSAVGGCDSTRYPRRYTRPRRRPNDRDATPVHVGLAPPRGKDGTARRPPLPRRHRGRRCGRGSGGDRRRHHRQRRRPRTEGGAPPAVAAVAAAAAAAVALAVAARGSAAVAIGATCGRAATGAQPASGHFLSARADACSVPLRPPPTAWCRGGRHQCPGHRGRLHHCPSAPAAAASDVIAADATAVALAVVAVTGEAVTTATALRLRPRTRPLP